MIYSIYLFFEKVFFGTFYNTKNRSSHNNLSTQVGRAWPAQMCLVPQGSVNNNNKCVDLKMTLIVTQQYFIRV